VVSGAPAMGFGAVKIGAYEDLRIIRFLHKIAFLPKTPLLTYVLCVVMVSLNRLGVTTSPVTMEKEAQTRIRPGKSQAKANSMIFSIGIVEKFSCNFL
jgi:hypothetical protein